MYKIFICKNKLKKKEIINPKCKLPLSPKKSLGNPINEKLKKNKKIIMGIVTENKKNLVFCSVFRKCESF